MLGLLSEAIAFFPTEVMCKLDPFLQIQSIMSAVCVCVCMYVCACICIQYVHGRGAGILMHTRCLCIVCTLLNKFLHFFKIEDLQDEYSKKIKLRDG